MQNFSLGDEETTLIRDTFILNMLDFDTQNALLKETLSPTKALEIAIHVEMGAEKHQKISPHLKTKAQSIKIVNNFQGRNRTTNYQQQRKDFARYPTRPQNYQYTSICANLHWSHTHRQDRHSVRNFSTAELWVIF